jgi:hypothetical protein
MVALNGEQNVFRKPIAGLSLLVGLGMSASQSAFATIITVTPGSLTECPIVGAATSCAALYRFNVDGSIDTLVDPTIPATDGNEDTLVGVMNATVRPLASISLSGTGTNGFGIFDFDGDGQSSVVGTGPGDTYFGLFDLTSIGARDGTNTFANINADGTQADVVFGPTGIVSGGSGWFVLEDQISFTAPPRPGGGGGGGTVPEPATLALLGVGLGGFAMRRAVVPAIRKVLRFGGR